jgi:hypothetical protein
MIRAQDSGTDRGVSYGARFGEEFQPSYPETTGYIIQTFLDADAFYSQLDLARRAREMGEWEISVQLPSGAVMGGKVTAPPSPAVFNTGQVLCGWAALLEHTGDSRFREAAVRAAEWMLEMQDPDGSWRRGNSLFARADSTVYNVQAAWGLALIGTMSGDARYLSAAVRSAEFARDHQTDTGFFTNCCLTDPSQPLTHTLAYAARGVLEVGLLSSRDDLVLSCQRAVDAVVRVVDRDGFLPGRVDATWRGVVPWSCLTGSAQFSIILWKLGRLTGREEYKETARRLNRFLMSKHDVASSDDRIRGGVPGSWPVGGDYGRLTILNWATKYFIDALLEQKRDQGT